MEARGLEAAAPPAAGHALLRLAQAAAAEEREAAEADEGAGGGRDAAAAAAARARVVVGHAGAPPPFRIADLAAFVAALGAAGPPPPRAWRAWLLRGTAAVLAAQLPAEAAAAADAQAGGQSGRGRVWREARRGPQRSRQGGGRQDATAVAGLSGQGGGAVGPGAGQEDEEAAVAAGVAEGLAAEGLPGPYLALEDVAALLGGLAGLQEGGAAGQEGGARPPAAVGSVAAGPGGGGGGGALPPVWVDLALAAAVEDARGRLSERAARAAAAAAAEAEPTAVLTRGDVSRARRASAVAAVRAAAAQSSAASALAAPAAELALALEALAARQAYAPPTSLRGALLQHVALPALPHAAPQGHLAWLAALAAWPPPAAAPALASRRRGRGTEPWPPAAPLAPPAWQAGVAACSRVWLPRASLPQLAQLAGCAAAGGVRLPPACTAELVRCLAARLEEPGPSGAAQRRPAELGGGSGASPAGVPRLGGRGGVRPPARAAAAVGLEPGALAAALAALERVSGEGLAYAAAVEPGAQVRGACAQGATRTAAVQPWPRAGLRAHTGVCVRPAVQVLVWAAQEALAALEVPRMAGGAGAALDPQAEAEALRSFLRVVGERDAGDEARV